MPSSPFIGLRSLTTGLRNPAGRTPGAPAMPDGPRRRRRLQVAMMLVGMGAGVADTAAADLARAFGGHRSAAPQNVTRDARDGHLNARHEGDTPPLRGAVTSRGFIVYAVPPPNSTEASATAIDLNGDGSTDNGLGQGLSALAANGIDFSAPVLSGEIISLMRVTSVDPSFTGDPAARADWIVGRPTAPVPPDFSGAGQFALDGQFEPTAFVAPLAGARFQSANPVTTTTPATASLQFGLGGRVVLPLNGARIRFTVDPNGLLSGQLNGSIRSDDIDTLLIPAFASEFNEIVARGGPQAQTILGLFDRGCNDVGGQDGFIEPCEVAGSLLGSLLAPDVDIYDMDGRYAPNPLNLSPESLSFGMAFTAANAGLPSDTVFTDGFE